MKLVGIAGALVVVAVLLVERGRQRWLASCNSAVQDEGAEFHAACSQTAADMSWLEALRIGLGGTP